MKKSVLVAFDVSGSVPVAAIKKNAANVISRICPNSEITVGTFDTQWTECPLHDVLTGNIRSGGGSCIKEVLELSNDFDHSFIVTDGYLDLFDIHTINTSSDMTLVIYE